MDNDTLVPAGSFCWNPDCPDYAQTGKNNLIKFGKTRRGIQRYRCRTCRKAFTQTRGTLFYGRRHSQETILECLALLAERNSLAAIHRVKGIKEETTLAWLREAAGQVERIEPLLMAHHHLTRVQLDALWTYVGHKGTKGGTPNCPTAASFGGEPPSRSIPAFA